MAADDAAVTEGTAPSPPRPTRSLESAEAAQGAGWGATTRTATTMSSSHLAAAVRTQPAPPRHHPPSTKQRVHRPPRPTPTPPTEVTEDGAVAAEREETDARSWRRMRGPQTPLAAWDAPAREWLRGEPVGQACPRHPGTPGRSIRGVSRYGLRCVALSPPMSVRMSVRPSEEDNRVIVTPSSDGPTVVWRRHRINNPTTSVE